MKLITKYKSLNYNNRASKKIYFIIIHYTALNNSTEAIKYLCNLKNKVSCHYLISKSGKIYHIVSDKKRAWHAGKSQWKNYKDLNSYSIGIELDFNPEKDKNYNVNIISKLMKLIKNLRNKYNIPVTNILGHSDIAPYRKIDPGLSFPWQKLKSTFPKLNKKEMEIIETILTKKDLKLPKSKSIYMLGKIGYNVGPAKKSIKKFNTLIKVYQSHYVKKAKIGKLDSLTYEAIKTHFKQLLTSE